MTKECFATSNTGSRKNLFPLAKETNSVTATSEEASDNRVAVQNSIAEKKGAEQELDFIQKVWREWRLKIYLQMRKSVPIELKKINRWRGLMISQ
ncbi:3-oxoacyl-ACP reductase [Sesbania bispinosa]|nr:3-oxoacyl-ACP reductase [Sesbania bispinosa]